MTREKNPHAVALGRLGAKARAHKLSTKQLSEIGRKGARARWKIDADSVEGNPKSSKLNNYLKPPKNLGLFGAMYRDGMPAARMARLLGESESWVQEQIKALEDG